MIILHELKTIVGFDDAIVGGNVGETSSNEK